MVTSQRLLKVTHGNVSFVMVHDYSLVPAESVISEVFAPPGESVVTGELVVSEVFAPPGESVVTGESVVSEVFAPRS